MKSIEEIKKIGLDTFVKKYNLKMKDYGHKFILKYDQINSPTSNESVKECRGLILSNDFRILSYPFKRFSSYDENSRKTIDWKNVEYFEKKDGTLIQYYYDFIIDKWCVGTTGTAEATDFVGSINKYNKSINRYDFSLTDLFYRTCRENGVNLEGCIKGNTYIFELACLENQVVNVYDKNSVTLLGIRNLETLQEYDTNSLLNFANIINVATPKQYLFSSEQEMLDSLKGVRLGDANFEGYVAIDKNFNRIKCKSNTYIIFHQFNGEKLESKWRLIDVVLHNEIEEVSGVFPQLRQELERLKARLEELVFPLESVYEDLKNNEYSDKDFFMKVQSALQYKKENGVFKVIFSMLKNNKDISFKESLTFIDKKKLIKIL